MLPSNILHILKSIYSYIQCLDEFLTFDEFLGYMTLTHVSNDTVAHGVITNTNWGTHRHMHIKDGAHVHTHRHMHIKDSACVHTHIYSH